MTDAVPGFDATTFSHGDARTRYPWPAPAPAAYHTSPSRQSQVSAPEMSSGTASSNT
jgi:hypothetical protein